MPKSVSGHELLPRSPLLTLTTVERTDAGWTVVASGPDQAPCPRCRQLSTSRHSRYVRTLTDVPAVGAAVSLRVCVGRWRCRQSGCAVRFFTGTLPGVTDVYSRRTCRADLVTQLVGHALGGRPGERLSGRLGLPISDDTILRRLKKCARPAITGVQVVGIDEWAKRKGRTYGTIVVDLEHRTVIDVLDTHAAEAVEQWLVAHPEIHTICRDRNGRYAKAARTGAPTAMQVADRFHLVQNLRETIERELCLHRAHLRVRLRGPGGPPSPRLGPAHDVESLPVCVPGVPRERRLLPARRLAVETEIARQRRQLARICSIGSRRCTRPGCRLRAIAHQLGRHRRRFDRWAKLSALPVRSRIPPRPGSAESFREYLRQRWEAGYRNGRMLFDEIRAVGYRGTYKSLQKLVSPWRVGNATFERDASAPTRPPVAAGASVVDAAALRHRPDRAPDLAADRRRVAGEATA